MERDQASPESQLHATAAVRRAHEFVAHEMLVLILSGRFRAGDRLPPGARARRRVRRQPADRAPGRRRSRRPRTRRGASRQRDVRRRQPPRRPTRARAGRAWARSWRRGSCSRSAPCGWPRAGPSAAARTWTCSRRSWRRSSRSRDGDAFPVDDRRRLPSRGRCDSRDNPQLEALIAPFWAGERGGTPRPRAGRLDARGHGPHRGPAPGGLRGASRRRRRARRLRDGTSSAHRAGAALDAASVDGPPSRFFA